MTNLSHRGVLGLSGATEAFCGIGKPLCGKVLKRWGVLNAGVFGG